MSPLPNLRGALWRLYEATRRDVGPKRASLERWDRLDADAYAELSRQRLGDLLSHAVARVPYYRELLGEQGVIGAGGRVAAEALSRIPILNKEILRRHQRQLRAETAHRSGWFEETSGGSTGEPVRLTQDRVYEDWRRAVKDHFDLWAGHRVGQRKAVLWGSERDLLGGGGAEVWRLRLRRLLRNERWLNAFRMDEAAKGEYLAVLRRWRPDLVLAYVESIDELARFARRRGDPPTLRAVMTSAGTLYGDVRRSVEEVFGAEVFNRYGSREVGDMASECPAHRGLHVSTATHWLEIVDDEGRPSPPGEEGEILVTLLTNRAMPLVRYRIGDRALWAGEPCPCGRPQPLLTTVTGRSTDSFVGADGSRAHGELFTHLLYFSDWVERFQWVQETVDRVRLLYVPRPGHVAPPPGSDERERLAGQVRKILGPSCELTWEEVEEIPPSPSGKRRYVVSRVSGSEPGTRTER